MATDILKSPDPGSVTFTDGDTDFIVTSTLAELSDATIVTGKITIKTFDDAGQAYESSLEVNFPRLGDGWGVNLGDVLRNFFPRVDMGLAGQCFTQNCFIAIRDIYFTFTGSSGNEIDTGGTGLYLAVLVHDPQENGYTDIYRRDGFLCLTSPAPAYTDGYFSFCYMQNISERTSVYLVAPDGSETLLVSFAPKEYHQLCFYCVAGQFSGASSRLEVRRDDGAVLATAEMDREEAESYFRHLLYLPSSLGVPELFVCTGTLQHKPELSAEVFDLHRRSILTGSTVSRSATLNSGYLSSREYERLSALLGIGYECALDGAVYLLTGGDFTFSEGSKNNVTFTLRRKWN